MLERCIAAVARCRPVAAHGGAPVCMGIIEKRTERRRPTDPRTAVGNATKHASRRCLPQIHATESDHTARWLPPPPFNPSTHPWPTNDIKILWYGCMISEIGRFGTVVSAWSENITVSFCLRAPRYGLTLWCALGLLVGGAIQVPQLQLQLTNANRDRRVYHLH